MSSSRKSINILPVIIAGGTGSRLWPASRSAFPKQFLAFNNKQTLFQSSCFRCKAMMSNNDDTQPLVIVANEQHRFLVTEQLREIKIKGSLLLEPDGRNTAPAMTLAALYAEQFGDPVLFVTPADHVIQDNEAFQRAAFKAIEFAKDGGLTVIGVEPNSPHTGYGYIKANKSDESVLQFVEKPDKKSAQKYMLDDSYFWNTGIFVIKASVWLMAVENFRKDIATATRAAWKKHKIDGDFVRPDEILYKQIPEDSVDYAVVEKLPGSQFPLKMVSMDAGWDDQGSWSSVWELASNDINGNALKGDVMSIESFNSYVNASSRLVGLVGMENVVVVETADAVLVVNKARSEEVKKIVSKLKAAKREEINLHRKVFRPWGWYDTIDESNSFKVKRIHVHPGGSLSLQKHYHRAEHWIVVAGTAKVICGDKVLSLTKNQSTYIPIGTVHRLTNPGETFLELIEVQTGSYFGEDDIVRFDDKYKR